MTMQILLGDSDRAVLVTCISNERPAKVCNTFGRDERMRFPSPAASITTLSFVTILNFLLFMYYQSNSINTDKYSHPLVYILQEHTLFLSEKIMVAQYIIIH